MTGVLVFALALALRLLFWQATPDASWADSAWYKGDAATWLAWAKAIQESRPFEVGLPIRPPGAAYLMAMLWNGETSGIAWLKLIWCLLGALAVVLVHAAVKRSFGGATALAVGLICAGSTGLMMLTTSLNNETPYLVLVAATWALWLPLWQRRTSVLVCWAALHAVACLVRAEHLLYFALVLGLLTVHWARSGRAASWGASLSRSGLALAVFVLVLLPWHLSAWAAIHRFNTEPLPPEPAHEEVMQRLESLLSDITWEPEALAELERLPAATRRNARLFVTATVAVRGGRAVGAGSLQILEQAFGYIPRPLPEHPYLTLYGGLNFYLANNAQATGGFDRSPLDRPPPLPGPQESYPLALVRDLPPAQLALTYPPHLQILDHGYRLGWRWIRGNPADALRLGGRKLAIFWRGAALGVSGHNLPLGLSGVRRQVDLVVPDGSAVTAWNLALLALAAAGLWAGRRQPEILPWAAFLLSKLLVAVAFFGYARQGASVIPVVALLAWLGGEALVSRLRARFGTVAGPARWRRLAVPAAVLLLLAVEAGRALARPEVTIDGRTIGARNPLPPADHSDRRIEVR